MRLILLRPDRKDETHRNGNLGGVCQWIESINQTLKGQLHLEYHGASTPTGVSTGIAQRWVSAVGGPHRSRQLVGDHHRRHGLQPRSAAYGRTWWRRTRR
jgi:hypothetical protein